MNAWWHLPGIAVSSFVVALSGAVMPGPLLVVTLAEGSRRGARAGMLIVLGHGILEAALVAALALGCGQMMRHDMVLALVSLVGGAVLGWMGAALVRASPATVFPREAPPSRGHLPPVAAGILVSLSNPYWTLWWATVGLALMAQTSAGVAGILAFFFGHIAADLGWYGLVAAAAARGQTLLRPAMQRRVTRVCGVFLVLFGLGFVWTGGRRLTAHVPARGSGGPRIVSPLPSTQTGSAPPPDAEPP